MEIKFINKNSIVHDWLVTYAGAERVLKQGFGIFPEADLFSLVDLLPKEKKSLKINKFNSENKVRRYTDKFSIDGLNRNLRSFYYLRE